MSLVAGTWCGQCHSMTASGLMRKIFVTIFKAQLSYMILHLHESGNFREQAIEYRERFSQLHADIQHTFQTKLETANRNIWTCDPVDYNSLNNFSYPIYSGHVVIVRISTEFIDAYFLQLRARIRKSLNSFKATSKVRLI